MCIRDSAYAWMARFRRQARDYERLPATLAGLHLVAFNVLLLRRAADFAVVRNSLYHYLGTLRIVGRFDPAVTLRAVSYTHLDVYKRQPTTWAGYVMHRLCA